MRGFSNIRALADRRDRKRQDFETEVLAQMDALYGMAMRLSRNPSDAEDLVQEAVLRALRFRDRFETGTNIRAWLFTILTNAFYNRTRKTKNSRKLEGETEAGEHYDRFLSASSMSGRDAEDLLIDRLSSDQLRSAVDDLPEEFRTVVVLSDVYEFSYKEIAEIVGCPIGTVMSRLYRGRRRLQEQLLDLARDRGLIAAPEAESADEPTDLLAYRRSRG